MRTMGVPERPLLLATLILGLAAALPAPAAARRLLASPTCPLANMALNAFYTNDQNGAPVTQGTVVMWNTGSSAIAVKDVTVYLLYTNSDSPYAVTASCPSSSIPARPSGSDAGTLTCNFQAPGTGWRGASARAAFKDANSLAPCETPVYIFQQQQQSGAVVYPYPDVIIINPWIPAPWPPRPLPPLPPGPRPCDIRTPG